jgi:hypothetical protein
MRVKYQKLKVDPKNPYSYIFLQRKERWGKPPDIAFSMFSSDGQDIAQMSVDIEWYDELQPYIVIKCFENESKAMTMQSVVMSHDSPSVNLWDAMRTQIAMATLYKFKFWNIFIFFLAHVYVNMYDSPKRSYCIKGRPFCTGRNIFNQEGTKVMCIQRIPARRLPSEISNVQKGFPKAITYKMESQVQHTTDIMRLAILWATIIAVACSRKPDGGN